MRTQECHRYDLTPKDVRTREKNFYNPPNIESFRIDSLKDDISFEIHI